MSWYVKAINGQIIAFVENILYLKYSFILYIGTRDKWATPCWKWGKKYSAIYTEDYKNDDPVPSG